MEGDHIKELVQRALDEFDDVPLATSARRAYRIARLRGDVEVSHRLQLELRPTVSAHDRVAAVRDLYPGLDYQELRERHMAELEHFMAGRTPRQRADADDDKPKVLAGSIDELVAGYDLAEQAIASAEADGEWTLAQNGHAWQEQRREILARIRAYVFDFLVRTETQIEVSDTVSQTLAQHRFRVDTLLERVAPGVRDQLQAALRTARQDGGEARSQVLTTCRRVIVAVADHLFPPSDEPFIGSDGQPRAVKAANYRNRILARSDQSSTAGRALASALTDLATRLDRLDELTQKGVHEDVTQDEMEFGLAQTYLLVGELLRALPAT